MSGMWAKGLRIDLRAQVSPVLFVGLSGISLSHEAYSTGCHVQSVDVMLGKETNAQS